MVALFMSQAMLYAAAALIGFAFGFWAFGLHAGARRREAEREIDELRVALSEAQVRRARMP